MAKPTGCTAGTQHAGRPPLEALPRILVCPSQPPPNALMPPSGQAEAVQSHDFDTRGDEGLGLTTARRVTSLADTNRAGPCPGLFIYPHAGLRPGPRYDWDPDSAFRGLCQVAYLGFVTTWQGTQELPRTRASSLMDRIVEYVDEKGGADWQLVADKAREVLDVIPHSTEAAIELGNAEVRLGHREAAVAAYRRPFAFLDRGILSPLVKGELEARIAALEVGTALTAMKPIRNPNME